MIKIESLQQENVYNFWLGITQSFKAGYEIEEFTEFEKFLISDLAKNKARYYQIVDENGKLVGGFRASGCVISLFFANIETHDQETLVKEILNYVKPSNSKIYIYTKERYADIFLKENFSVDHERYSMIADLRKINLTKSIVISSEYEIHSFSEKWLKEIADVIEDAYKDTEDDRILGSHNTERVYKDLRNLLKGEEKDFVFLKDCSFLATHKGSVVGVVLIALFLNKPLVFDMAVSKRYQGKGIGKALLLRSMKALSQNYSELTLFVTKGNTRAERLYHSLGFKKLADSLMALYKRI